MERTLWQEFTKGMGSEIPIFRVVLGLCPTLAVTTSLLNGIGMGVAATFVLVCSNIIVSMIRNIVPAKIRIPIYIVVIATFVSITEMIMAAYTPALYKALGIFVPLIVVNCIILGRAEAFAGKFGVIRSTLDGIGMGIGFTIVLCVVATIREMLGDGKLWGFPIMGQAYDPMLLMILPAGGFFVLGLLLGVIKMKDLRTEAKKRESAIAR
jgi:Na+-translocating ferredoxin:NAD+ oxidoreductase subunit E